MSEDLQRVLSETTYEIIPGDYYYLKADRLPQGRHFMVSDDGDEITVVTAVPEGVAVVDRNRETYALLRLNVAVPFYSVGFLAAVTNAIASRGVDLLIVSTFSKDYVLVRKQDLDAAVTALEEVAIRKL